MLDFSIPRKYRALIDADRLTFAFQKSVEMLGLSPQTSAALKISDDASIRKLNKAYRGLDEATDVLSFETDFIDLETGARFIGDIVISIEKAQAQAAERGFSLQEELEMLLVHAVLHLNGYDHLEEADLEEMGNLQDEILIAIGNPLLGSISRE
ncbi:MAG: rRNA maturation RNase YbeY [Anaerolineales bacterium]|nr:rRNA maturation RNase YbeY [Anaerolineales bacterium]